MPRPYAVENTNGKIGKPKAGRLVSLALAGFHKERRRFATPPKALIEAISREENIVDCWTSEPEVALQTKPSLFRSVILEQPIAGYEESSFTSAFSNQTIWRYVQHKRDEPGLAQQRK